MTEHKKIAELEASAVTTKLPSFLMTLEQKRELVTLAWLGDRTRYRTLSATEYANEVELRTRTTDGTILEPAAKALGVEPTHGAVMDALELTTDQMHDAFCECNFGQAMNGDQAIWSLGRTFPS